MDVFLVFFWKGLPMKRARDPTAAKKKKAAKKKAKEEG